MTVRRPTLILALTAWAFCAGRNCTDAEPQSGGISPVVIDYFYEQGCSECRKVDSLIKPELGDRFEGFYILREHDLGAVSNVLLLAAYQEELRIAENRPVYMVVDYRRAFSGFNEIEAGLLTAVETAIERRLRPEYKQPEPVRVPPGGEDGLDLLARRVESFTLPVVAVAGFLDGLNPCATASLVFFMSVLVVSGVRGRVLLVTGISFCAASFAVYTAIGFGLAGALHAFSGFHVFRRSVELALTAILFVLAFLSFRDAFRYRARRDPEAVTLRLPVRIKRRIHALMRSGLGTRSPAVGGFVIGTAVTVLESVCTGQVYVPTLVLIIRNDALRTRAWQYLLLYNLMFVTPLAAVFLVTYLGVTTEKLLFWSRRNVPAVKILLGCLFAAMGLFLLLVG
ncbi:MAG: hypothetical protein R6V03_05935 [Kiritimatiellia bacterium]